MRMKTIDFKNIYKLCRFNLLTTRKTIIGWTVAIFSIMTLYMILFPSIQDIATVKFEAMPDAFMQFVGMEDLTDMSDYINYYGIIYSLILVAVSIFAATFSAGLISREEKSKSIEFLNALAVSRLEIYISKYLTSTIAIAIVLTSAVISVIACGFIGGGETFVLSDIITSAKIVSFPPLFFGAIALMIAGISAKIGTGATAAAVVLVSYMVGYLGQLLEKDGEILLYFSPFITLNVQDAIALSDRLLVSVSIYVIIYIVVLFVGGICYNRRDLQI